MNNNKSEEFNKKMQQSKPINHAYDYLYTLLFTLFIPFSFLFMEIVARVSTIGIKFGINWVYIFMLTMFIGFLFSGLCGLLKGTAKKVAVIAILIIFATFMSFHVGYYNMFQSFFCIAQIGVAGDAINDFSSLIVSAALNIWYVIIIMFLPVVVFALTSKYLVSPNKNNIISSMISLLTSGLFFVISINIILTTGQNYGDAGYTYTYVRNEIESSYEYFGFINTTRLDLKQMIFGEPEAPLSITPITDIDYTVSSSDNEFGYNVSQIDFGELANKESNNYIRQMHNYVNSQTASKKNEYTGYFKGKNLIMLTVEGFSGKIIDPEFTPTLYKMSTNGFVFNNYYHSAWGGSTGSGEYTNLTGNIYYSSVCLLNSAETLQPLTMANNLKKQGYSCYAYHNNTYTYYRRDLSHPNFGYVYKGKGNGLNVDTVWPESDLQMAQLSVDDYINDDVFHVYYMTVSGHLRYNFAQNSMSSRHYADLPSKYKDYPDDVKAYLACEYEVELMLQYLVQRLEEKGILDDTVFVLAADHYPYGLSTTGLSALYNLPEDDIKNNFELYKNSLIIWSSSMEKPVIVDKYCSAIDTLPTLLNLWGIDFDSRLLIGRDILSDSEGIAIVRFYRASWKSDMGTYNCNNFKFYPSEKCTLSGEELENYVKVNTEIVNNKLVFSRKVLDNDYYSYVFN